MKHPNALTATGATGPAVLLVWLAGHFGIDLNAEQATVVTGLLIAAALVVGRRGVKGIAQLVWRGDSSN